VGEGGGQVKGNLFRGEKKLEMELYLGIQLKRKEDGHLLSRKK